MSANRLFLVCSHHPNPEDALCLAERAGNDSQYTSNSMKRADDWFAKHQGCGRGCDHFQLAHARPMDWDAPKPAESTPAGAVRLALVSSGPDTGRCDFIAPDSRRCELEPGHEGMHRTGMICSRPFGAH